MNKLVKEFISNTNPYCIFIKGSSVKFAQGSISKESNLSDLNQNTINTNYASINMVPFCQLKERGFETHDSGEKIISLTPLSIIESEKENFLESVNDDIMINHKILGKNFDDHQFMKIVQDVIDNEIKNGEGSNFLLSRKVFGEIENITPEIILKIIKNLMVAEFGSYITFCFYDGEEFFIGASPEVHLSIYNNLATMNPICGTLPKEEINSRQDIINFINNKKEINELFQVVDETLKMMSDVCQLGGKIHGPFLKEMAQLIHTEYTLQGQITADFLEAFKKTMYAPTMVGSPIQNAARIIKKYESDSRAYYSSAILFLGKESDGKEFLDSAITIRTMRLSSNKKFEIQAGCSIVRDSTPESELSEINSKTAGMLSAINFGLLAPRRILEDPLLSDISINLNKRNSYLSKFWMEKQEEVNSFKNKKILILDNKDDFSKMLGHMFKHLKFKVTSVTIEEELPELKNFDLVLLGPGPGNPENLNDPRIARLHETAKILLREKRKFISVCLGHQVVCKTLGFPISRIDPPVQGIQKEINLFESRELVGFYNTFFAINKDIDKNIHVSCDENNLIVAIKSENYYSVQFHLESILTNNGISILKSALYDLDL